jgi:predicted GNAT family acetyltransferase
MCCRSAGRRRGRQPRERPVTTPELRIVDNPDEQRYEARLGDELVGHLVYGEKAGQIVLLHTEVDRSVEGHGIGSRLVAAALKDIRDRGLSARIVCPFVRAYVRRHPEYSDLMASR